ncbi:MAG: insulinase family protein [Gammaproteobacteria bacterium]|nr:insulinase family protein [Gammaproteobacteria bacterium]
MRIKLNVSHLSNTLAAALLAMAWLGDAHATPNIQHWETSNGARVYFVAAPELPIVDVQVVFDGGAARDGDKNGVALLTNGLLSEGAADLNADQIAEQFDALGARFGNSSERDMAVVTLRSLSEPDVLDPAIALLNKILTQPTFPADAFERERNRLLTAIEQRKQSPGDLASEAFYKAVFGHHPYASLPEGQESSVKALTAEDLRAFYQQYYVAKNAVIAIVGNLDRQQAEQLANNVIAGLPAGQAAPNLPAVDPLAEEKTIRIEHPSTQTHILVGAPGMKRGDEYYFDLYVGNHILGGNGLVSRLSQEVRENRGLSYSTYSYFLPMRKQGPFILGLQTKNETADEALQVLKAELVKFVSEGPSAEELEAAKKNITGGFPLRISSNSKIVGYIAMIGFYDLPLDYLDQFNAKIEAVTLDSIKTAFQNRIHPDKMATVLVGGGQSS